MRTLFISLACVASLLSAQPVLSAPVSRIVAVVNGDMITSRELDKAVQLELAAQKVDSAKNPQMAAEVRKAVLDSMINNKILLQEAEKEKISVSDDEVSAALDQIIKDSRLERDVFFKQMAKDGVTEKAFRENLYVQLVSQRLMARNVVSKVVVTEGEINDYYRKNVAGFASGRARVGMLVYPADVDAEKWARDIASGKVSFHDAARKVSIGPNAEGGGDLGFMALSDMAPGMLEQISRLKKGEVSPLLNMNATRVQIALLDFEEAENTDQSDAVPDPDTARRIEQILRQPRLQERFQQYTAQLRDKALIDIRN
ncbi:SurA N-terminal domain-containing protein [Mailhella massiliensis]|uniref:SurA N-terminal domain-containing protein n=1 Tax=Mailhella massiliensis TaxID=1903261 RepID=A0A921AVQ8_9BACT|nr:SurA N-terminal domain-containing protein [Mailhella massiliensis]HJD96643.1 SurA N-terminal domain-containing protein [Mailhella massiliensis]